jgi:hypothetical protein
MKATLLIALATDGTVGAQADGRLVVAEQGKAPCCYVEGYIRFLPHRVGLGHGVRRPLEG